MFRHDILIFIHVYKKHFLDIVDPFITSGLGKYLGDGRVALEVGAELLHGLHEVRRLPKLPPLHRHLELVCACGGTLDD